MGLAIRTVRGAGRTLFVTTVATSLLNGLLPIAGSLAVANLIGAAPGVTRNGLDSAAGRRLVNATIAYVAVLVLQGLANAWVSASSQWLRRQLDGRLRERVMRAVLRPTGIGHFEDPDTRAVLEAARNAAPGGGMSPGAIAAVLPHVLGYRIGIVARI